MTYDVGIIGYGVVGQAMGEAFQDAGLSVVFYDIEPKGLENQVDLPTVVTAEVVLVSVPTPTNFNTGQTDLSILDGVMEQLSVYHNITVVIKSTVPPGTTQQYADKYPQLKIVYSPEFLTEKNAKHSFVHADRHILCQTETNDVIDSYVMNLLQTTKTRDIFIYDQYEIGEIIKYASNVFLATKVAYANMIFDLADKYGVDYNRVKNGITIDRRIGDSHFDVTPERGFGGMCFPKDIVSLIDVYEKNELDSSILRAVWEYNKRIRNE